MCTEEEKGEAYSRGSHIGWILHRYPGGQPTRGLTVGSQLRSHGVKGRVYAPPMSSSQTVLPFWLGPHLVQFKLGPIQVLRDLGLVWAQVG